MSHRDVSPTVTIIVPAALRHFCQSEDSMTWDGPNRLQVSPTTVWGYAIHSGRTLIAARGSFLKAQAHLMPSSLGTLRQPALAL